MKVIQDNRPQFNYPFRTTCMRCKGVLEVEQGDVKVGKGENQWGASYDYFYVVCPLCKNEQLVQANKP
ncbi:MAG: hypothetical protein ACRYFX_19715 [Janthinobacterium lividum]